MDDLVSVCIISYNSGKTVTETLNSIYNQSYENLELIVSDDASKDDTVSVVSSWLEKNKSRFVNSKLITVPSNTGTAINCSRCIAAANGSWVKLLAADDMLKENAIAEFVKVAQTMPNDKFFCCDLEPFSDDKAVSEEILKGLDKFFNVVKWSVERKRESIDYYYGIMGPAWFFSKQLFDTVGGFDERFPMFEEWPFVYKIIKSGYDIKPVDKKLVLYRVSTTSLTGNTKSPAAKKLLQCKIDFFNIVRKPVLLKKHMFLRVWEEIIRFKVQNIQTNSNNKFVCFMAKFLYLFSPRHCISFILKKINY